ncbi:hypothetical protein PsYK624_079290 [Phanerochaete sordida]|uniref:Uncharacterized protein n=1 Tax=Phanerochaete sordida TaxID=48140 RepID=A0A9P3GBD4_9APHY|nr:hypothetical protein PsYK624_079290 [Phanerochaete sordida]
MLRGSKGINDTQNYRRTRRSAANYDATRRVHAQRHPEVVSAGAAMWCKAAGPDHSCSPAGGQHRQTKTASRDAAPVAPRICFRAAWASPLC